MTRIPSVPPELAEQYDQVADLGYLESVPDELPEVGGFDFVVIPSGIFTASHSFGGYDIYNEETGETESLVLVSEDIPREARGLLVAHIVMHKVTGDDGSPHLCVDHDKAIQRVVAEAEPSLLEPFYKEAEVMYRQGFSWYNNQSDSPELVVARYRKGLSNSEQRGQKASQATIRRGQLADEGLILSDDELMIVGIDKRNGQKTHISLQQEAGTRHKCRDCSHPIPKAVLELLPVQISPIEAMITIIIIRAASRT